MKKILVLILALALFLAVPEQAQADYTTGQFRIDSNIYEVNGVAKVMDVAPFVLNGRTFIPIRFLGYALGIADENVVWDEATQTIYLSKSGTIVCLQIGNKIININGSNYLMDVPPLIQSGRTFLPARFVAEAFNSSVGWDSRTKTVLLSWDDGAINHSDSPADGGSRPLTTPGYDDLANTISDAVVPPYIWDYKRGTWNWDPKYKQSVVDALIAAYKELPHPHYTDYDYMNTYCVKTTSGEKEVLQSIVNCLKQGAKNEGYNENDTVGMVVAFVQSFTYVSDSDTTGYDEYPRYPLETLFSREGDCEDTAILTACLIRDLGYGTALIIIHGNPGHCAVGVLCDNSWSGTYYELNSKRYYYLETTSPGWQIGQIPDELKYQKATVLPLP